MKKDDTLPIEQTLLQFVVTELLSNREIDVEDNLLADGAVDSVGMVRLATFASEEFGISVPPEDFTIDNFRSITALSQYVSQRLSANKTDPVE